MTDPPRDRHIPDLVSLAEAAAMLGVSKQYLHRQYLAPGTLRGAQAGGTWVFRRTVVERLAAQHPPRRAKRPAPD